MTLLQRLESKLGTPALDLCGIVLAISRIPYGRNRDQTAAAVIKEWRGTCSTKHLLLRDVVADRWPQCRIQLWHRPYAVTPRLARELWGGPVAAVVPQHGLKDVHTFATLELDGTRVAVDVTAPLQVWDGRSSTPLQCGAGQDVSAGDDPLTLKRTLVERHCDPAVREPLIAALAELHRARVSGR